VNNTGRGEKGFGIMRDGAISMLSEIAQPFDSHRHHAVPQFREPRRQDVRRASAPTWSQINRGWGTVRYWSPSYYNSPRPRVN